VVEKDWIYSLTDAILYMIVLLRDVPHGRRESFDVPAGPEEDRPRRSHTNVAVVITTTSTLVWQRLCVDGRQRRPLAAFGSHHPIRRSDVLF